MRTTIAIDDLVLAEAKAEADARGITLGALVTDALRQVLDRPSERATYRYRPVVYGAPGKVPSDPAAIAALLDDDDEASIPWRGRSR